MSRKNTNFAKRSAGQSARRGLKQWLLQDHVKEMEGPFEKEHGPHHTHSWWKVMCLTGVDYFSTLGYQPGIAFVAAGALAPIATLILVLLTLFGALPIYRRVAQESPHGEGSISMLENLLSRWRGKLFVLVLLGFVATDFIITITLSAADATAHIIENPYIHHLAEMSGWHVEGAGWAIGITLLLITLLGAIFIKGFKEAIGIAVLLVATYLLLNFVVIARGLYEVVTHPDVLSNWTTNLLNAAPHGVQLNGNVFLMIGMALFLFPKLALGLSGFETGVAVMPLVKGAPEDTDKNPQGRIRNTRKLLMTAALIMSVFLITSSIVTTTLIPADAFRDADPQNERFFRPSAKEGHAMFDLPAFIGARLTAAGVGAGAITDLCTYADAERFYSYRRTTHRGEPDYGRQISAIAMTEK